MAICPFPQSSQRLDANFSSQQVRPVGIGHHRRYVPGKKLIIAFVQAPLETTNDSIEIVDTPEAATGRAIQRDVHEGRAGAADSVGMTIKGTVDENVAGAKREPPSIADFITVAAYQQRSISTQMMMTVKRSPRLIEANFLPRQNKRH